MKSKAHSKKCMDLGVSVGLIDDQDGEEEFGKNLNLFFAALLDLFYCHPLLPFFSKVFKLMYRKKIQRGKSSKVVRGSKKYCKNLHQKKWWAYAKDMLLLNFSQSVTQFNFISFTDKSEKIENTRKTAVWLGKK